MQSIDLTKYYSDANDEDVGELDKEHFTCTSNEVSLRDDVDVAEVNCLDIMDTSLLKDQTLRLLEYNSYTTLGYLHNQVSSSIFLLYHCVN